MSDVEKRPRLFVVCSAFPVMSETFIVDHIAGMVDDGWRVTVVAYKIDTKGAAEIRGRRNNPDFIELVDWRTCTSLQKMTVVCRALQLLLTNIPSHIFSRTAWSFSLRAVALHRVINAHDPNVIHAHFGPNGVTAALASRRPLLVDFHGYDLTSWPKRWGWWLYTETLRHSVVIAHSDFVEKKLSALNGMKIKRVTMGVDMLRFRPAPRDQSWSPPLRLLSVGRLVAQKGHDVVLRALVILRKARPDLNARFRIVGAGPDQDELERLADDLALPEYLSGPASVDSKEMPGVYSSADLLVAASQSTPDGWEEAFCRAAIEAMACGLPVVATPCGGLPDTVGTGGVVAATQDAESLAAAIEQVLTAGGPEFWQRRAIESASRFTINKMHDDYSACTKDML